MVGILYVPGVVLCRSYVQVFGGRLRFFLGWIESRFLTMKPGLGDLLFRDLVFGWVPFGNELNPSQATLVAFEFG